MQRLSVIVPCYNEEDALPVFLRRLKRLENSLLLNLNIFL